MDILSMLFGKKDNAALDKALEEGAFLVDVRTPGEFASGSAKGAVNIPLDFVKDQISKFRNKKNIIVFCRSGNRSAMAKGTLERNGITNVLNGGSVQNMIKLMEQ
ncbi:Rhodanese-related sulfurtransferase [Chryseobacterium taichungense]|uniref:Rhodanese-related sulfurtransferase n=1 Tax=Chryseobacterium taichungense TaxID=295069 RepID=A0A1H7YH87_9FLAO|nr:rhodanese-like domain-containing protein [Chryseobacterium taichungense]SEM45582.1 Rhodanese-related sulfurtransferase [Chryseobacterium taichungense]